MAVLDIPPPPPRSGPVLQPDGTFQQTTWAGWFRRLFNAFNNNAEALAAVQADLPAGLSVTITTSALTGGGTEGSMKFVNGILVAQTPAT